MKGWLARFAGLARPTVVRAASSTCIEIFCTGYYIELVDAWCGGRGMFWSLEQGRLLIGAKLLGRMEAIRRRTLRRPKLSVLSRLVL